MHKHDHELIMALAESRLEPAAAATARAEVEACPECALDLELQVAGLQALQALPAAGLTELESARLHRNLHRELGIAKPEVLQHATRRRLPLAALGTAAAVLVAVVVIGPGLNLIGGAADSDDTPQIVAATTVTSDDAVARPEGALDIAPEAGESFEARDGAETSTTAAPQLASTPTTLVEPVERAPLYAYFGNEVPDLEAFRAELLDSAFDEEAARSQALRYAADSLLEEDLDDAATCIEVTLSADDGFVEGFPFAQGRLDDREVLYVVYLGESLEATALVVHAADSCEELQRVGP